MSSMIPPAASLLRSSGELVWPCVYNACILPRGSRGPDIPEPPGGVHANRAYKCTITRTYFNVHINVRTYFNVHINDHHLYGR